MQSIKSIEPIGSTERIQNRIEQLYMEQANRALLFYGPTASGKMTMALRQAKFLNCSNKEAPCDRCVNCEKIRSFSHPDVQVIHDHYVLEKLERFFALLLADPPLTEPTKRLFQTLLFYLEDFFHQFFQISSGLFSKNQPSESEQEKRLQKSNEFSKKKRSKPSQDSQEKLLQEFLQKSNEYRLFFQNLIQTFDSSSELLQTPSQTLSKKERKELQNILNYVKDLQKQGSAKSLNIESMRQLLRGIHIKPFEGRHKVLILKVFLKEELNHLLLRTLEELPKKSTVILITEQLETIRPTVQSRCLRFRFRAPSLAIQKTILKEKWGISFSIQSYQVNLWKHFPNPKEATRNKRIKEFLTQISQYRNEAWLMGFVEEILKEDIPSVWLKAILEVIQKAKKEKYLYKTPTGSLSKLPNHVLDELFLEGSKLLETLSLLNLNPSIALSSYLLKIGSSVFRTVKK